MKSDNHIACAFIQLFLALASAGLAFLAPAAPDRGFIALSLAVVVASLMVVLLAKRSEPKPTNWMTADILFSVSFSIVHFAYVTYWMFGYFPRGKEIWYFRHAHCPEVVSSATAMFASCLCFFLFGFYLLRSVEHRPLINRLPIPTALCQQWGTVGRLLLRCGFLCFAGYVVLVGPEVVFGEYAGTNIHGFLPNILFQLGMVILVAGVAVVMSSNQSVFRQDPRHRRMWFGLGIVDVSLVAITVFAIALHGDRSTLLFILVGILLANNEYRKPLTLRFCGFILVSLLFAFGFIGAFRASEGQAGVGMLDNVNAALVQFGSSALCGFVAVDFVPDQHDYYYGKMQMLGAAGLVPFGRRLFGMTESVDSSSSSLFTLLIQGQTGRGVSGTGTSVFADFYLDFGFLPTAAGFAIIGMVSKYIQNRSRGSISLRWQIAFVCYGAFIATVSRYAFLGGFVRQVLYAVLYASIIAFIYGVPMHVKYRRSREKIGAPRLRYGAQDAV